MQHNVAMGRYSQIYGNTMKKILSHIINSESEGITQKELLIKTPYDRTTIYRVTKKLENNKLIEIYKEGKLIKYIAKYNEIDDISLSAFLLNNSFISRILHQDRNIILSESMDSVHDFRTYKKYYQPKFDQDSLEKILFEFANRIGGYITYVLIQSINPKLINSLLKNNYKSEFEEYAHELIVKTSESWIINSINPNVVQFLWEFLKHIKYHSNEKENLYREGYFQDENVINKLLRSFSNIYPHLYKEIEDIMDGLEPYVQKERKHIGMLTNKKITQKKCDHKFNYKKNSDKVEKIKVCSKCGFTKTVKFFKTDN